MTLIAARVKSAHERRGATRHAHAGNDARARQTPHRACAARRALARHCGSSHRGSRSSTDRVVARVSELIRSMPRRVASAGARNGYPGFTHRLAWRLRRLRAGGTEIRYLRRRHAVRSTPSAPSGKHASAPAWARSTTGYISMHTAAPRDASPSTASRPRSGASKTEQLTPIRRAASRRRRGSTWRTRCRRRIVDAQREQRGRPGRHHAEPPPPELGGS